MTECMQAKNRGNEPNVLTGPPGLLFGLTLLVFLFAGLYFSWVPAPLAIAPPAASDVQSLHR